MSDYPPTPSYGASYGPRDQANPPYVPPTYPNQYMQPDDDRGGQGHIASNYDASMSAYAYNRALPAFSAAAVASGVPPLPIYQGWNQEAIPLPPYTAPHNTVQYPTYGNNTQNGSQFYQSSNHQDLLANAQSTKPYEQGELSEGEFEDTFATHTPPTGYGTSHYGANGGTGYGENMRHTGYSSAQAFPPHQSYSANNYQHPTNQPSQLRRQQSASYSPFVSPAVADCDEDKNSDAHANSFAQQHAVPTARSQYKSSQNGVTDLPQPSSQSNGYTQPEAPRQSTPSSTPIVGNGKTVAESRKKAEAAILNLLPYDIRYQTYIDEGFREDIVGRLFDNLKMPRNSLKASSTSSSHPVFETTQSSKVQMSNDQNPAPSKVDAAATQLANDNRKAMQEPIPSNPEANTQQSAQPSVPKSAAMIEKERTLQSKMEALRKSREERAQKAAAAKEVVKPVVASAPVAPSEPAKTDPEPSSTTVSDAALNTLPAPVVQPQVPSNHIPSNSPAQISMPQLERQPSIPGLFLASNGAIPGLQLNSSNTPVASSTPRKRPVAADFDDTASAMTPFKRPFGHHRNDRPLVINVSEDEADSEDEDVAMDLESAGDQDSPMQTERKMSGHQSAVLQSSAPVSDKVNKSFTPPPFSSANNTPPLPSTIPKPVYGGPADLQRKQSEIEELKRELQRRIAEKEAKKRAKQTPSRTRTPRMPGSNGSETKDTPATNGGLASKVETSVKMQEMISVAQNQVNSDQQKLVDAQAAEAEKFAELEKNESEQRQLLRKKNATDQSLVDAKVLQTKTKLEELKAAMAEAEAAYQKSLAEKQRLKEEAERLEQETDLQEKRDKLQDLTNQKLPANDDRPQSSSHPVEPTNHSGTLATSVRPPDSPSQESDQAIETAPDAPPAVNAEGPSMGIDQVQDLPNGHAISPDGLWTQPGQVHDLLNGNTVSLDAPVLQEQPGEMQAREEAPVEDDTHINEDVKGNEDRKAREDWKAKEEEDIQADEEMQDNASTNQALEAALQEAVRAEADLHAHGDRAGDEDEDEEEMDVDIDMEVSYAPDPNHLALESSSGHALEIEGSPEYSPVLDRSMGEARDRESDDYEPPEASAPSEVPVPDSPPFSPAPPDSLSEPKIDESADINSTQASSENGKNSAGELLSSVISSSPKLVEASSKNIYQIPQYTPYESPLKLFRAYRFHPEFIHDVPGGLRSKTYSHKIDPNQEFCRYELAGGICNDPTCEFQHFRDVILPDDAILTALGSPEEFTGEQRDKFCAGLKEVLMDLRKKKIRDFDIIASEIVAHRAKFLGDKSKVLALEGTAI